MSLLRFVAPFLGVSHFSISWMRGRDGAVQVRLRAFFNSGIWVGRLTGSSGESLNKIYL